MSRCENLHRLIDELPDEVMPGVLRILEEYLATDDPKERALLLAPLGVEPDATGDAADLEEVRRSVPALPEEPWPSS